MTEDATGSRAAKVRLSCSRCDHEFDQPLTNHLTTPVCPACGYAGDRQVSTAYPFGPLAGGATRSHAADPNTGRPVESYPTICPADGIACNCQEPYHELCDPPHARGVIHRGGEEGPNSESAPPATPDRVANLEAQLSEAIETRERLAEALWRLWRNGYVELDDLRAVGCGDQADAMERAASGG